MGPRDDIAAAAGLPEWTGAAATAFAARADIRQWRDRPGGRPDFVEEMFARLVNAALIGVGTTYNEQLTGITAVLDGEEVDLGELDQETRAWVEHGLDKNQEWLDDNGSSLGPLIPNTAATGDDPRRADRSRRHALARARVLLDHRDYRRSSSERQRASSRPQPNNDHRHHAVPEVGRHCRMVLGVPDRDSLWADPHTTRVPLDELGLHAPIEMAPRTLDRAVRRTSQELRSSRRGFEGTDGQVAGSMRR